MHAKTYKLRGLTLREGRNIVIDLNLEFEGKRAFAIWESINVGNLRLTARVEIDPKRLEKSAIIIAIFFTAANSTCQFPRTIEPRGLAFRLAANRDRFRKHVQHFGASQSAH